MDIITTSIFKDFCNNYGYEGMKEEDAFERFAIYCVISQHIKNDTISKDLLENMCIGGGNDWGLDGFVMLVNGKYVSTEDEIINLLETNGYLSVEIFTIQAKTSTSLDSSGLAQSLDGVQYLMDEIAYEDSTIVLPPSNEDVDNVRALLKSLYSKCAFFKNGINPILHFAYVICANYSQKNKDIEAKLEKTNNYIKQHNLICGDIRSEIVDKNILKQYYDASKRKNEATIKIEQKLNLPEVNEIKESYLCIVPFSEFKKLIIDDAGDINLSVFDDNVRAFQGENTVNKAIAESLKKGDISLFTAMNNGITIIAKETSQTGCSMKISDYQIVNGCQTCHILYNQRDCHNVDDLRLVVKIISSTDKVIKDKIIVANNSQTEVKREQLISLMDVQKNIESYYYAQKKYEQLYYERRSKQYRNDSSIKQCQIVTIPFQIKVFVSMILGLPDEVRGYYGQIIEQFDKNGQKVFHSDINPALYYTSALAGIKLEKMFADGILHKKYKRIKFHVLYAFRLMVENGELPSQLNNHKVSDYCNHICKILCDEKKCENAFRNAVALIDKVLERIPKDSFGQSKKLTQNLKITIKEVDKLIKAKKQSNPQI